MSKKVFLSYSWKDRLIASRIYQDLARSNVTIWRDQIDGDPLADFEEEFLRQIDECDYFIMLDSENYRKKSHWCCEEVERCLNNIKDRGKPEIIVCLLDKDGEWRNTFHDNWYREIFSQVNRLKYKSLYYQGYDNEKIYDEVLNFICNLLCVSYERWDKIPSYQDLMDEMKYAAKEVGCDEKVTDGIIKLGYRTILNKQEKNYPNIKESYNTWIKDCKYSGMSLFFPMWSYAVWYSNQSDMNPYEALALFKDMVDRYPHDFRGYRGQGCLAAIIGNSLMDSKDFDTAKAYYEMAEKSLLESNRLMDDWQRSVCGFEVQYNLGMICRATGRDNEALLYWEKAQDMMKRNAFFNEDLVSNIFMVKINQRVGMTKIINWLEELLKKYSTESLLYQLLGLSHCNEGDKQMALKMMQTAYSINPSLENLYHLLNIKKGLGYLDHMDANVIEKNISGYSPINTDDKIWLEEIMKILKLKFK